MTRGRRWGPGVLAAALLLVIGCGSEDRDAQTRVWRNSRDTPAITLEVPAAWREINRGSVALDVQFVRDEEETFSRRAGLQVVHIPEAPPDCALACYLSGDAQLVAGSQAAADVAGVAGFRGTVLRRGQETEDGAGTREEQWTLLIRDGEALVVVAYYPLDDASAAAPIRSAYERALATLTWPAEAPAAAE